MCQVQYNSSVILNNLNKGAATDQKLNPSVLIRREVRDRLIIALLLRWDNKIGLG